MFYGKIGKKESNITIKMPVTSRADKTTIINEYNIMRESNTVWVAEFRKSIKNSNYFDLKIFNFIKYHFSVLRRQWQKYLLQHIKPKLLYQ